MEPRPCAIPPCVQKWKPLEDGINKINVDAITFADESVGLGAVMRDHHGDVMAATCKKCPCSFEVDIAEAMSARHGIRIALDAGLSKVIL